MQRRSKKLSRLLALLLSLAMVLSLVPGIAMADETDDTDLPKTTETEDTPAVIDDEGSESSNAYTVSVDNSDDFIAAFSTDYTEYDELIIQMTDDIVLDGTVGSSSSNTRQMISANSNVIVDGQNNTLSAAENSSPLATYMFRGYLGGVDLTFRNMTIDAGQQYFMRVGYNINLSGGSLTLDGVKLKNFYGYGDSTYAGIVIDTNSTSCLLDSFTLNNVQTQNCVGQLMYLKGVSNVNITNESVLEITANSDATGSYDYMINTQSLGSGNTLTLDGKSTLKYMDTNSRYIYGIYVNYNWNLNVTGDSIIEGAGNHSSSRAIITANSTSQNMGICLGNCTILNDDGSSARIQLRGSKNKNIEINGDVKGKPELNLYNYSTYIQLDQALSCPLYFSYRGSTSSGSDISGRDPVIVEGTDEYTINENDLENLIYYYESSSIRELRLTEEEGESNTARLYRPDVNDCEISLLNYDHEDENGIPVYMATAADGEIKPDITVVTESGKDVSSDNYTLEYSGELSVSNSDEPGEIKTAYVTVVPNDSELTGEPAVREYKLEVDKYTNLGGDAPVSVIIDYNENGDFTVNVYYNDILLIEGEDYILTRVYDYVDYTATFTIEGRGNYGGVYELTINLPGRDMKIQTVYNEETLNTALADKAEQIYFSGDIVDLTEPVVVDYDTMIDGNGYTLYAGELVTDRSEYNNDKIAVLDVESGIVTLNNVILDGMDQARTLYVGSEADVTITGGSEVLNGGFVTGGTGGSNYNYALIWNNGVLTLEECTVKGGPASTNNNSALLGNMGTMNISDGAYLTEFRHCINGSTVGTAPAISNKGTLNWTGGTFDVNVADDYNSSGVISNSGTFNLSGGLINGFMLDEAGTSEKVTSRYGAIQNSGVLNMSGGTIQGFNGTGYETGSGYNFTSGDAHESGGGVFNSSTFNMTGGEIVNNTALYGGGVFNVGTFHLSGGTISGNEALSGGGVYNSSSLTGSSNPNINFYMTGGTISGNTLTSSKIESKEYNPDENDPIGNRGLSIYVSAGSSIYISGGTNAEISGGTIIDDSIVTVETTDEDEKSEEQAVSLGIAVSPVNFRSYNAANHNNLISYMAPGKLTITDSPDIETGIVLVNFLSETEGETNLAWLELDGALEAELSVTTLDEYINIDHIGDDVYGGEEVISLFYRINQDGDIVAAYKDRVTTDKDDAQLLKSEASVFQTHEHFTLSGSESGGMDQSGWTWEETFDFDAWCICTHSTLEHVYEEDPTCTENGHIEYWQCETCGAYFRDEDAQDEITEADLVPADKEALGHDTIFVDYEAPTCLESGHYPYYQCQRCGGLFTDAEGTEEIDDSYIIPATGHTPLVVVDGEPATATTDGWGPYVICGTCHMQLTDPEIFPATGVEADDSALSVAIAQAEDLLDEDIYTADSLEALQEALTAAKEVADKDTEDVSQTEVNNALETLLDAIVALEKNDPSEGEDDTALNIALDAAQVLLDEEDSPYTEGSLAELEEAMNDAADLAEQEGVQAAVDSIMTAIRNLEKTAEDETEPEPEGADKSTLDALVNAAETLTDIMDSSDYTADSWNALTKALANAKSVAEDSGATQDDVTKAVEDLTAAINGLTKAETKTEPANKTDLNNAIESAQAKLDDGKDYTAESKGALESVLAAAKVIAADGNATQDEVDAMAAALNAAVSALETAGNSGTTGQPEETKNGFVQENGEWHYYADGKQFTGNDIKEDTKKTIDGTDGWYYIVNGKVDFSYTGVSHFKNAYGWWYVKNGKVDFSCNSVEQNQYGWWYVVKGKVDFSYTGVSNYSNAYGWWYIEKGKVNFGKTGIEPNNYGWWRVVDGKVDFSCNSVEQNSYGWWYVVGGKVDFGYTGVSNYSNAYGWWYIEKGKVDFSCNSVGQNQYGWWYILGGKVQFGYTGVANYANAYGWWYIKEGKVDFSYTGTASNNYGTWNVVNGKVIF